MPDAETKLIASAAIRATAHRSVKQVLAHVLSRFRKSGVTRLMVDQSRSAPMISALRRIFDDVRKFSGVAIQRQILRARNATDADGSFSSTA